VITADFESSCTVQLYTVLLALVVLVDDIKLTPSFLVCLFVCLFVCMCVYFICNCICVIWANLPDINK